jgi:hypothetical protein
MDMELEADLGIDSIKRVQILGTLQEALPDLPRLAPEELAELRTLRQITDMMNAGQAVTESAPPAALSQSAVRIRPLPEPDTQDYTLPAGYVCLLTDDGTDLTGALAAQFMALHWPVMLLQFPRELVTSTATLPTGLPAITLEDMSEETLAVALQTIQQEHGPVGAFLHLHPPNSTTTASEQIVRHIFLLSNQLHQPLTEAAHQGQSWFFTVTHIDGAFGMEVAAGIDPVQGGLSGLVKSLNLEWEHVFCRALDINLDSAQAVNAIVAELFDPNWLLTEVAYSSQGRRTRIGESLTG